MKISAQTISILKNFSSINKSLVVRPGNIIRTLTVPSKSVLAQANVQETFPTSFAIFELSKLLGAISLFKDPEFDFFDDHLKISEEKNFIRYTYADESTLVKPPEKELELPSRDISFDLPEKDLSSIMKATSILQVPEVMVVGEDGTIYVKASNSKNPSSDQYSIPVGVTDKQFKAIFKSENLNLMSMDYQVDISNKGFAEFRGTDIKYWVSAEQSSKWE